MLTNCVTRCSDCFCKPKNPTDVAILPGIETIYLDSALIVVNKPPGLLSVPGRGADKQDCLSSRVQQYYPDACVVHRLDMATSGLFLMARGASVQRQVNALFASRQILKRYEAMVDGIWQPVPAPDSGGWTPIDLPLKLDWPNRPRSQVDRVSGKPSLTHCRVLCVDAAAQTTHLLLEPVTGRSHQLRVHLMSIGHPILGDALYAPGRVADRSSRLLLHASELQLQHPVTGAMLLWVNPPTFEPCL